MVIHSTEGLHGNEHVIDIDFVSFTNILRLNECTLIHCVRNLKHMKLKYNLYWLRSMKDDPMRLEIVREYLNGITD